MSDEELVKYLEEDVVYPGGDRLDDTARYAAKRIRELLTALSALCPTDQCERVCHLRRGTKYIVLGVDGELQSSGGPVAEGTKLVTYMGSDWRLWHRPTAEFRDGRFETINRGEDA